MDSVGAAEFESIDAALSAGGPGAALERLVAALDARKDYRALLDALLLKARHELGLPPIQDGSLADLAEPQRTQFEDRYVESIRLVGRRFLGEGDIVAAWPYFRAIAEREPVAAALDTHVPAEGDEQIGQLIEVAFNQGAHPRKGWELILEHYGACSAITAFEHLPQDETIRRAAADRLIRHLHEQLSSSVRADIARRGQPAPPDGATVSELIAGRPWLFYDDAYHIDISHLGAAVRIAPVLTDERSITLALGLADYGRNLSERHQYDSDPPFERLYDDHAIYLGALIGRNVDAALAHFRAKLPANQSETEGDTVPAQVLVRLLCRLERLDEAIELAVEHLSELPESALACPSLPQLCQRAGRADRLARSARARGDLVHYAAALLARTAGV
jgi:hypothetical protein